MKESLRCSRTCSGYSVLGATNCIFSFRLASSIGFPWAQKLHASPLTFSFHIEIIWLIPLPCAQDIQILLSQIFLGAGKWRPLGCYSSPPQILCFYPSWCISRSYLGLMPGKQSACFSTPKETPNFWGADNYSPEFGWKITKQRKYLPVPGRSPACIQISSIKVLSRQLLNTYLQFTNIKYFFQIMKKCFSKEKSVVSFSELFHLLTIAHFVTSGTALH